MTAPAILFDQARHYAAVRARLWPAPPRQFIKREWFTPTMVELPSASDRFAAIVREIIACRFVTSRGIIEVVALAYDLPVTAITARCRRYAEPRQIAMALAHRRMKGRTHGLAALERAFKRDHSTILHAVRKLGPLIESVIIQSEHTA